MSEREIRYEKRLHITGSFPIMCECVREGERKRERERARKKKENKREREIGMKQDNA